jgi:hypothetical protein
MMMTRTDAALGAMILASMFLFAVGLVSPLTPSEGCPSTLELAVFAGLPIALPIAASPLTRHTGVRAALLVLAVAIGTTCGWLLGRIGCLP